MQYFLFLRYMWIRRRFQPNIVQLDDQPSFIIFTELGQLLYLSLININLYLENVTLRQITIRSMADPVFLKFGEFIKNVLFFNVLYQLHCCIHF